MYVTVYHFSFLIAPWPSQLSPNYLWGEWLDSKYGRQWQTNFPPPTVVLASLRLEKAGDSGNVYLTSVATTCYNQEASLGINPADCKWHQMTSKAASPIFNHPLAIGIYLLVETDRSGPWCRWVGLVNEAFTANVGCDGGSKFWDKPNIVLIWLTTRAFLMKIQSEMQGGHSTFALISWDKQRTL